MQVIYRITSPSGRAYIGQTKNFKHRMSEYRTLKVKNQRMIYASLKKYGFDAHDIAIIQEFHYPVSQRILDDQEKLMIQLHRYTVKAGLMNLTDGGRGNGNRGPQPRRVARPDAWGEKNHFSKLTESDVTEIRGLYTKGVRGRGIRVLAHRYKVGPRVIYQIVNNKTWAHLDHSIVDGQTRSAIVRLTETKVVEIKRLHAEGASYVDIAARYGVSNSAVRDACIGKTWKHVTPIFKASDERLKG